jgi:hypothetical protein
MNTYTKGHTMTPEQQACIDAIRESKKVGLGTCSDIDECWSDEELIRDFCTTPTGRTRTPQAAVRHAEYTQRVRDAVRREYEATAF